MADCVNSSLSGSHRSTHIASDLASRVLASQAKPQRESELQTFRIARSLKNTPMFRIAGQHRRISQAFFLAFSCDFRSSECVFASLAKKLFRIASDLGMCDSNRIAHRGCVARFGPPRFLSSPDFVEIINCRASVEFGKIREISGKLQGTQWNSVGFCMAVSMNSVEIPGGFRGNAGFSGNFGVWGGFGRFGGQKAFAQRGRKNVKRCPPTGTGTKIEFPRFVASSQTRFFFGNGMRRGTFQ